jgi:hypothetical protein
MNNTRGNEGSQAEQGRNHLINSGKNRLNCLFMVENRKVIAPTHIMHNQQVKTQDYFKLCVKRWSLKALQSPTCTTPTQ